MIYSLPTGPGDELLIPPIDWAAEHLGFQLRIAALRGLLFFNQLHLVERIFTPWSRKEKKRDQSNVVPPSRISHHWRFRSEGHDLSDDYAVHFAIGLLYGPFLPAIRREILKLVDSQPSLSKSGIDFPRA